MLLIGGLKEGLTAHTQTKSLTVNHLEETSAVNRSVDSDLYTQKNRMTFRKSSGFLRRVLVLNLNLPISFDSMSYISLSTNLVAKCDIQVDAAKVADIFDLPKFGATFLPLEERIEYIRRVFAFSKNTFRVKRRGAGLNHLSS